jgi:hypothetical protein
MAWHESFITDSIQDILDRQHENALSPHREKLSHERDPFQCLLDEQQGDALRSRAHQTQSRSAWVCPKCGRVYAPWMPECQECNKDPKPADILRL